jgi:crossover junction endodeoxyribonuclease RusA
MSTTDPEVSSPLWGMLIGQAEVIRQACEHTRADLPERDHVARHFGEPCPYEVSAALLLGEPDPRDLVTEWSIDISSTLIRGAAPLTLNRYPSNHFAKNRAVAAIKARVRNAVRDAELPHLDRVHVQLHFRPATALFRDQDNLVATLKPAIDALHQKDERESADLDQDRKWVPVIDGDDPRYVTWIPPVLHPPVKKQPAKMWLVLRSYSSHSTSP